MQIRFSGTAREEIVLGILIVHQGRKVKHTRLKLKVEVSFFVETS